MEQTKAELIIESIRAFTGSIMKYENIIDSYKSLTQPKREYLYALISKTLKYNKLGNDIPLVVVELNVLAAESNVDPGVLLLAYFEKGKVRKI